MVSELKGLLKQEEILVEKLNRLRPSSAIQSDPSIKFTQEKQIEQNEAELEKVRRKIRALSGLDTIQMPSILGQKIKKLDIDAEIGEVHLVNCNREKVRNRFWTAFDNFLDQENPFQFYYVLACPTQQPTSFGERMIYELIDEELDGELEAISYVNRINSSRVKIEDLPIGRNLRNSQKEFKKYFTKRFGIDTSFEKYLETGLPKLEKKYEYIVTVFDINASKWNNELMQEYMQWIIDSFSNTHEEVPQFLFFFAVFLRDVHEGNLSGDLKETLEGVKQIIQANPEKCTLLDQLLPVPVYLLEDWIRDLGEQNQTKIQDVIKTVVLGLPADKQDQYKNKKILDMSDIECFQELIYEHVNKK